MQRSGPGPVSRAVQGLAAMVIVLAGLKLAAAVVLPIILAIFIAVLTWPLVKSLSLRGVPHGLAIGIGILVDVAGVVSLGGVLATSATSLYQQLPRYLARFKVLITHVSTWLAEHKVQVSAADLQAAVDPGQLVGVLGSLVGGLVGLASNVGIVLLITAFLLMEGRPMRAKLRALLRDRVDEDDDPLNLAAQDVQKYLGVKTVTSLITGVVVGLWFALLGVDFALLWGVLAFMLNYIPTIGSFIAVTPPIFIALLMQGPGVALAVAAGSFLTNFLIGNVIEPRVLGKALGLSPSVILLSMILWGWLLGPFGAILSVPLTMIARITFSYTDELGWLATLLSSGAPHELATISEQCGEEAAESAARAERLDDAAEAA